MAYETNEIERVLNSFEGHHFDQQGIATALQAMQKSNPSLYKLFASLFNEAMSMKGQLARIGKGGSGLGSQDTMGNYADIRKEMNDSVGDMYIQVKRTSNTVVDSNAAPLPLPYCLFGINDIDNNYNTLMGPQLQVLNAAASTKIVLSVAKVNGNVVFTYTQGNHADTVTISFIGSLTSYTNALNAQNQDNLNWGTRLDLYTISDPTNGLAQIQTGFLNFNSIGISNNLESNILSINSRKLSDFFQDDRVEMIMPVQHILATTGIVDQIIPVPVQDTYFQIVHNIFQCYKGSQDPHNLKLKK